MVVTLIPLIPKYVMTDSWHEDANRYHSTSPLRYFSTTKWLSYEAVQLATDPYEYQWLTSLWGDHLDAFFAGVAAPRDSAMATGYTNPGDYGDISSYRLYLDDAGVVVTENNLSVRAQVEYDKLVNELNVTDPNEALCAFYAGTTAHYVSQAGTWGAIWDETSSWGPISNLIITWRSFETQIETGITTFARDTYWWTYEDWYNTYFTLSSSVIAPSNASEATIQLAKNIHHLAYDLGNNFTQHVLITAWTPAYMADVQSCLEYSVEAIFSVLQNALLEVNWKYIDIPLTTVDYVNNTNHLSIDYFQVNYTDSIGTNILNNLTATEASFRLAYFPLVGDGTPSLGTDVYDLSYNGGTDTWYFDEVLINGTVAMTEHRIYYTFNMNGTTRTWSNGDESFISNFLYVNFTSFDYHYSSNTWMLDIWNVAAKLENVPEIDFIEPDEVDRADWFLYQKGEGSVQPGTEPIGIPGVDTENRPINGSLEFDVSSQTWYDNGTDIGWFHTPETFDNYIVVRFRIDRFPIGYLKYNQLNQSTFVSWAQATGTHYFTTRFHTITISAPTIRFYKGTLTVDAYNITAKTDYTNATYDGTLDRFEIHEKEIPPIMEDTREAKIKIYLFDGIASNAPELRDLSWDDANQWWYYNDIDVSELPDNWYFAAAEIINMNVNVSVESVGLPSELFQVKRPFPVVYYILPEVFLIGFVALFGWLAWWRPRKKRIALEKEREEKLDKGFMD